MNIFLNESVFFYFFSNLDIKKYIDYSQIVLSKKKTSKEVMKAKGKENKKEGI